MAVKKVKPKSIYQLKVTLKDINPPIWRRLLVSPSTTLFDLNDVLQLSMGWMNCHLHQFTQGETRYQPPDPEADKYEDDKNAYVDSRKVILSEVLSKPGDRLEYLYDFGDGWEHEIILEEILPPQPRQQYPYCVDGARACPPEDCGSTPGYEELVEAMRDPKHPERERFLEWLEGPYDPEKFDLKSINWDLEDIEDAWYRKS